MLKYIPAEIEPKWQKLWAERSLFKIDLTQSAKKYYLLVEFTYPSGDLHMGHWFAFAVPDILSRMKRMQGYTVFAPNGFDAFGLPAENAAIQRKIHPRDWTLENIERMKKQFETMGALYDWEHEVITCSPNYYKWNQWIFLKMLENGLAYRGKTLSNWCPNDQTVLANENVENGRCWRCGSEVVQKEVEQWFLKITDYAERLLWKEGSSQLTVDSSQIDQKQNSGASVNREPKTVNQIDWPKPLRDGQNNWIGKSEGTIIKFRVDSSQFTDRKKTVNRAPLTDNFIEVFTTRPDTLYGATFLVLAPEHPFVASLLLKEIREYIKKSQKKSELERKENRDKTGVFTGVYAINPINGEQIPVWIADYALMGYGTGALFGDAHDERDVEFAKKYKIPLKPTLLTGDKKRDTRIKSLKEVFSGDGILFDSGKFSGLKSAEAREKITAELGKTGNGYAHVTYYLHDWSISRQRYWGTPIPVIYCVNCWEVKSQKLKVKSVEGRDFAIMDGKKHAINPVPLDQLPVELPYDVDFAPKGKPPLATAEEWVRVKCPNCASEARREVETMDTFVDSSWYFLGYLRDVRPVDQWVSETSETSESVSQRVSGTGEPVKRKVGDTGSPSHRDTESPRHRIAEKLPWDAEFVKRWMPVDIYFGGAEHTLGHTLYSRFFVKFLQNIGVVPAMAEYAKKRVHHGVILGSDGSRMSKSRGNVVNPDDEVSQYGADAVRLYLAFLGPYDLVAPWNPGGIGGVYNFLQRVWKLFDAVDQSSVFGSQLSDASQSVGQSFSFKTGKQKTGKLKSENRQQKTDNRLSDEDFYWMHKTIKKVNDDIESIKFNTAVAALMEWLNYLSAKAHKVTTDNLQLTTYKKKSSVKGQVSIVEYEVFLKLLAPFAPHITEELYQRSRAGISNFKFKIANFQSIHSQPWPEYDPGLVQARQITLVVQVNGRVRDKLLVEAQIAQKDAEELALGSEKVQKFLEKKKPRKVVFVPDRLINLVVSSKTGD